MPISIVSARSCSAYKDNPKYLPKNSFPMVQSAVRWVLKCTWENRAFRAVLLTLVYAATLTLCFCTAYQIRFDFDVPPIFEAPFTLIAIVAIGAKLLALLVFQQFDRLLTYFGKPDLKRLFTACMIGSLPIAAMSAARNFAFAPPLGVLYRIVVNSHFVEVLHVWAF